MPTERRPLSLALRITAFVGLTMTAMFVIFTVQIEHSIARHFEEQDLGELRAVASSLDAALGEARPAEAPVGLDSRLALAVAGHHGVYFAVRDEHDTPHYGTAPAALIDEAMSTAPSAALDDGALRIWSVQDRTYRGALLQMRGARVLVAVAIDSHIRYLARLHQALWWGTLAVCAVAVLAAWLAVIWGHTPIRRLSTRIASIRSERLHVRLESADVPVELKHLVASFNLMLDRLQESFERLSHFSGDIAHELRTPVTNLTTQTEVALSKVRTADAYREVLYSNLEELERMGKMIGDMLFLAQADRPLAKPELADIDFAAEVRALFDYFEALAEDRGVRLRLEGNAPAVRGNRLMLRRAVSNLISNGLRYVPEGKALTVRISGTDEIAVLSVENPGPDIAPEHLPRLFDRFYRVDPARRRRGEREVADEGEGGDAGGGAGLGLAIVKSIVLAHGGTVSARSGAGTTRFTLRLPVALDARER